VPLPDYSRLKAARRWSGCLEAQLLFNNVHLVLNTEVPPFDRVGVRQAVSLALDRERWGRLNPHLVVVARGVLSPNMPGHDAERPVIRRDLEAARRLLQQSGSRFDFSQTLRLVHYQTLHHARWAGRIQDDLAELGLRVELVPINNSLFGSLVGTRGAVSMALEDWTAALPDGKDFLENVLHSRLITDRFSMNSAFYASPEFDALVEAASSELDPERRLQLNRQAEDTVLRDLPWVSLGHRNILALRQPWVKGPLIEPLWWYRLDRVWKEQ